MRRFFKADYMYWHFYWIWLALASIVTFFLYGFDKARAKRGGRRVSEATLHVMSLVGGFPGGWAGRAVFRHKTRKGSFLFILVLSTALHLGLVILLVAR